MAQDDSTQSAFRTLDALVGLKQRVADQRIGLDEAHITLGALADLKDRAAAESAGLGLATSVVNQWSQIQGHLIAAEGQTCDARRISDELISLEQDLVSRASDQSAARSALEGLVEIRQRLDAQAPDLAAAHDRAESLILLKDKILAQTANLAEAIETLELTTDLQEQLEKAVRSFQGMRHAVIEIMAFEPTVEKALLALQPLTALGNLRHLNGGELREVARTIRDQRKAEYGRLPAGPAAAGAPIGPSAGLPPAAGNLIEATRIQSRETNN